MRLHVTLVSTWDELEVKQTLRSEALADGGSRPFALLTSLAILLLVDGANGREPPSAKASPRSACFTSSSSHGDVEYSGFTSG
ncbi:hypothetical protein LIER_27103 [Lithospermum erythrorhizon]|uniref:Uncharacterized protein n=1 Tax=Lithospermum erythrorhizon TaxID=34254 RepID=A0AAV3RAU6_LITER